MTIVFSIFLSFVAGGVFLYTQGVSPVEAYSTILRAAFGSFDFSGTIVRALPLAIVSLAVISLAAPAALGIPFYREERD